MSNLPRSTALIIIDVQQTFDDSRYWGKRDNPDAETNIQLLASHWTNTGRPLVMVTHTSEDPASAFYLESPSSKLKPFLQDLHVDLEVAKTVNSAFLGTPDLRTWLGNHSIEDVVLCGIQTNMCVETSARMAGNLGLRTVVAVDACHTFDLASPEGAIPAELLSRITAANLQCGEFARVTSTADILREAAAKPGKA